MSRRPPETLADYLAIAVCPFLIFLLVASLMFFLVEVFYEGEFKLRLQFIMAMFCMAIVCIARIAMEEGSSYATLYALPLGGAVAFAVSRLAPGGLLISWPLMGIVWWAAHKLTWDCTLVDDSQEASGQGLLQEMGLDPLAAGVPRGPAGTTVRPQLLEATTGNSEPEKSWWEKLLDPDRRPHSPGVWVVYFSLAALPLFGIGGWFVPTGDAEARTRVFQFMVVYVGSGLGLLLATSFLGLRRYLRQRNLEMPAQMTATWIAVGGGLIAVTLLLATILPRTKAEHSLTALPFAITSAARRASQYAFGPEGTSDSDPDAATTDAKDNQSSDRSGGTKGESKAGQGDKSKSKSKGEGDGKSDGEQGGGQSNGGKAQSGKAGEKSKGKGKAGEKSEGKTGEQQEKSKEGGESSTGGQKKKKDDDQQQNQSNNSAEQSSQENSQSQSPAEQPQSSSPPLLSNLNIGQTLLTLIKWLFYLALLIAAVVAGWIYREQLAAAWQKLLAELRDLWSRWFGKPEAAEQAAAAAALPPPPRPFAAFADPFAGGEQTRMPWPELIRHTFAAAEAWAREHGCPRHPDQTPHEFAQALGALEPQIAAPIQSLAAWYAQLAYAPRAASAGNLQPLRQLWTEMRAST
ncbi:MAG TPA: DUF4129 domain-containing protein, partial [Pirellulaceae bacterium]|nr:DUF4129 domain-containing protein [Pirellulaceae bacterium]